jgi:hypothetical protein
MNDFEMVVKYELVLYNYMKSTVKKHTLLIFNENDSSEINEPMSTILTVETWK